MTDVDPSVARRFPIGSKVTLSKEGADQFPTYQGDSGIVTGYRHGRMPKVKFDNRKTIDGWHPDLLQRDRRRSPVGWKALARMGTRNK